MCPSAQFNRIAKFYHTDFVSVFFAKKSHCAHLMRFFNGRVNKGVLSYILPDKLIYQSFRLTEHLRFNFFEVGKVKTKSVRRNMRALLFNVVSQ